MERMREGELFEDDSNGSNPEGAQDSSDGAAETAAILEVVRRTWGFDQLRDLQLDAIRASIAQRDSLVVLPTGGGKSLCYQVPPLVTGRTDVVVSPLISLMKDQVDGLRANGYPAVALHSGLDRDVRQNAEIYLKSGECRLVLASPERLMTSGFQSLLAKIPVSSFAIDEAHCISHWGHDFRPEYRQLTRLRERFPEASFHAFTATATERVKRDIVTQLGLVDPTVLSGRVDRANLIYRVVQRTELRQQLLDVLGRHLNEAVIVYCMSRSETERLAAFLQSKGHDAEFYHAGLEPEARRRIQDRFASEELDVIVATVAFGMGIDRSNVRCVVHAGMPKSIEHFQQETGRAGRDGLEAECVLFYSPADALKWMSLIEQASEDRESLAASRALLDQMRRYCMPSQCRHRTLSEHFGQTYDHDNCGTCDVCLGENEALEDGLIPAQKILSCVARVREAFGMGHVVDVLRGADTDRVRKFGHDSLSTYGLMKDEAKSALTQRIYQLLDQDLLTRTDGNYPVLRLNEESWRVLRGEREVWFLPTKKRRTRKSAAERDSWDGVDRPLFSRLRELRTSIARERDVPPYVIFSDATLRDMARLKPSNDTELLAVHGVGEKKLADLGEQFLAVIAEESSHSSESQSSESP